MSDVHDIVKKGIIGAQIAIVFLTLLAVTKGVERKHAVTATCITVVLLLALLPFRATFTFFHQVLFPQGNWQFAHDSWLITHFPPSFFAAAAASLVGGAAVLLATLSWLMSRKS